MIRLIMASLRVIEREFPSRSFLKEITFTQALQVYLLLLVVSVIESLFSSSIDATSQPTVVGIITQIAISVATLLIILVVTKLLLNRYVQEKFSFKETFILEQVLTAGSGIVFSIVGILAVFGGTIGVGVVGIFFIIFSLYMLFTFQKAISHVASISLSQAANVVIAPIAVLIIGWIAVIGLGILSGFAPTL